MNGTTLLLRQIHPAWVQSDRVTSQAFRPTPKDGKRLSVYDGDQITPEQSWRHFTQQQKLQSTGVLAVTVDDCQSLDLPAVADPVPYSEHAVIIFDGMSNSQIETKAKRLRAFAESRSWLYMVEPNT